MRLQKSDNLIHLTILGSFFSILCFPLKAKPTPEVAEANGPTDWAGVVEARDKQVESLRDRLGDALELYSEERYHKASAALYGLMEEALPPDIAAEARVVLGQSLEVLGMTTAARHFYREAVLLGPQTGELYQRALEAWAGLGFRVGDTEDLGRCLVRLPVESDPADVQGLSFLRGRWYLENGDLESARDAFIQDATPETVMGRQAQYLAAVVAVQLSDRASAFDALLPLTLGTPEGRGEALDPSEELLVRRIRELSLLALGRIQYSEGRMDEAAQYFSSVPADSYYWSEARYELAWVELQRQNYFDSVNLLGPLRFGEKKAGDGRKLSVEAELLAGRLYLMTDQYDLADGVLRGYMDRLFEVRVAIRDFARAFRVPDDATRVAGILFFGGDGSETASIGSKTEGDRNSKSRDSEDLKPGSEADSIVDGAGSMPAGASRADDVDTDAHEVQLPENIEEIVTELAPLLDDVERDQAFQRARGRVERCQSESRVVARQFGWWLETDLGQKIPSLLEKIKSDAVRKMGVLAQEAIAHDRLWFSELNIDALALRREITLHRLAQAEGKNPSPYEGKALPPFDFIR